MPVSIPITGLAANDVVPGTYIQIDFASGPASAGVGTYSALLMGLKTSAGSATPDTVVYGPDTPTQCASEADVIALFGTGSELHRMWRRFVKVNKTTPLYLLAVSEGAGTAASGTLTIATTATSSGTLRTWVEDDFIDTPITTGDTPTVIAANAATAINGKTEWPVTAGASLGVVTLTAKQKGPRGNSIKISAQVLPSSGVGSTVTPTAPTALTSGATLEVWTTALTTIAAKRYYYLVLAAEDSTTIGAVTTQVLSQAQPVTGIRQRVVCGSSDTAANAITLATGASMNIARAELVWQPGADLTPAGLAAHAAAVYSLGEAPARPKLNFDGYGQSDGDLWFVRAPRNGSAPTRAQILSALNNGVTPIASQANGSSYLVKRVTSRSLNGSNPDYRIRDGHKVTLCDRLGDDLQTKIGALIKGKEIGDDPGPGAKGPGPNVVTPRNVRSAVAKLLRDYAAADLIDQARIDTVVANTIVLRETSPRTRFSIQIPFEPIDIVDQAGIDVQQVA